MAGPHAYSLDDLAYSAVPTGTSYYSLNCLRTFYWRYISIIKDVYTVWPIRYLYCL